MRVKTTANLGAYLSTFASCIPTILYATLLAGQYTTPQIYCEVTAVFTNTTPVDAYRGAGRPEATYVVERLVETAARELKIDPAEIRRRNFIRAFPYQTPVALQYDTGDYEATLDAALKLADVQASRREKPNPPRTASCAASATPAYIEACGIAPSNVAGSLGARAGLFEAGEVRVHPTGTVTVFTGSHQHGQGHETTFAQVVADRLGMPMEDGGRSSHGDTSKVLFGMGTYGSRSIAVGGTAIVKALDKIVAKGKKIAAHLLEAAEADIEYDRRRIQGRGHRPQEDFRRGRVRSLRAAQLPARQARARPERERVLRPRQLHLPRGQLHVRGRGRPDTGNTQIVAFTAVRRLRQDHQPDDRRGPGARRHHAGHRPGAHRRLPLRGIGQLVTGSFMDYCMPRAADVPLYKIDTRETPCTHNPLGVKGCGEAGAIGAPAAVMNAITDALGVKDVAMPATAQTVWKHPPGRKAMHAFEYHRPGSTKEALGLRQEGRGQVPRRRPEPGAGDEAASFLTERSHRPGNDQGACWNQVVGRRRRDRRDDAPRRRRRLEGGAEGDPGARRARRHHRRPPGAPHGHHRRLARQQRSGGRLSRGGARPRRHHHHQQAQDRGGQVLQGSVRDRARAGRAHHRGVVSGAEDAPRT